MLVGTGPAGISYFQISGLQRLAMLLLYMSDSPTTWHLETDRDIGLRHTAVGAVPKEPLYTEREILVRFPVALVHLARGESKD